MKTKLFQQTIYSYYHQHRRTFPWRQTTDPYLIMVSEFMLQQTQTQRVLPKYKKFVAAYPTVKALAKSPLADVLLYWQGLGYNRRAKYLHESAKLIYQNPKLLNQTTPQELKKLPGIGEYTANAITTFAFNQPQVFIETNIRTVFLHFFFEKKTNVTDQQIIEKIRVTLDIDNPRSWYYALMDYGVYLKQTIGNQNTRSKHYAKQTKFVGSNRQIRGQILKLVLNKSADIKYLKEKIQVEEERIQTNITNLINEGLLAKDESGNYQIKS